MNPNFRRQLYNFLVNRHPGIAVRYHRFHDGTAGIRRALSYPYLLGLNFAYYCLFCFFLGEAPGLEIYESKRLPVSQSESAAHLAEHPELGVEKIVEHAREFDYVSCDVFDTLIFRPLSEPADLFYFVGERLGYMDFRSVRMKAEADARARKREAAGHTEVTLAEIWAELSAETGLSAEEGMRTEQEIESALCYANPFMLAVWERLREAGKRIIVVSDMYLPADCLKAILERNGFDGAERIFISNAYGKNKASGSLFEMVREEMGGAHILHIGDNPHSDGEMARKAGFAVIPYPQVNRKMLSYRPYDMSAMVGSAYRGIVSNWIYNGLHTDSMEYEYGFLYGGLFVLGYCGFIHEYACRNGMDKILFLSRDGDILKKAYDFLYPDEEAEYVYWSRKAAAKLMADEDRHDYFRRFLDHKVNQGYSIRRILESMELGFLEGELGDWLGIRSEWMEERTGAFVELRSEDELTDQNVGSLRRFLEAKWDKVLSAYAEQQAAAEAYYRERLSGCSRAVAVDIGWAGSGALALSHLVEKVWEIPCEIKGIVAGTNTPHNAEPDQTEAFFRSGKLTAYLFSQEANRDLLKRHDPNRGYNVYWELLLSSPTPQFQGFYADGLRFGELDANPEGAREIQRGIMDFVREYKERFRDFPYMLRVSGRDAYAPMLAASGHKERHLREIAEKFDLRVNVE